MPPQWLKASYASLTWIALWKEFFSELPFAWAKSGDCSPPRLHQNTQFCCEAFDSLHLQGFQRPFTLPSQLCQGDHVRTLNHQDSHGPCMR